jgi:hypothetical protein
MMPRSIWCQEVSDNDAFFGVTAVTLFVKGQVRSNIIVAFVAELVIDNETVNELPNARGLTGHHMQQRQGLNLACCGEFAALRPDLCQPQGRCG